MHEQLYVKIEIFEIEVKSQRGFENRDMLIILIVESTTLCLSFQHFNLL
jgi:hypothetical protein